MFLFTGALYGSSKSGWFDMGTFTQWFIELFLPYADAIPGKKFIIGDNLGCHFCEAVLLGCRQNNIAFIPLIPNSTHISQPLDVTVFRPVKEIWDQVLSSWRNESRQTGAIPKTVFPALLKRTLTNLQATMGKSLISGRSNKVSLRTCIVKLDKGQLTSFPQRSILLEFSSKVSEKALLLFNNVWKFKGKYLLIF